MSVLKVIEVLASSETSWEDATKKAVEKASKSVKHIRSVYVQEHSATVKMSSGEFQRICRDLSQIGDSGRNNLIPLGFSVRLHVFSFDFGCQGQRAVSGLW